MMPPAGIAAYGRDNPCKKSMRMEVRAKKSLGQHFLTDLSIAQRIADSLTVPLPADAMSASVNANEPETDVLEIGPGMGVLTQYLLQRRDIRLKMVEIDRESVDYLLVHFPQINGALIEADFLKLRLETFFNGRFCIIGNFPYNISSQILFRLLDVRDRVPVLSGMFQKEVAERIASPAGRKAYGILSVLLQAFYDIEYLFTVPQHVFDPPPKVQSAVVRLTRNGVQHLDCDEALFRAVVKTAFNQRHKTLRNSLQPLVPRGHAMYADPLFDRRPEQLTVADFIRLTRLVGAAT